MVLICKSFTAASAPDTSDYVDQPMLMYFASHFFLWVI